MTTLVETKSVVIKDPKVDTQRVNPKDDEELQLPSIREFDMLETMKDTHNFSCAVYGARRKGKSVLIADLIHKTKKWYTDIYVFSQSAHLQPDLFHYVPKHNITNSFDEAKLKEIWNRQEQFIMSEVKKGKDKKDLPIILLIFDDVIADARIRTSKVFVDIHVLGRHLNIASIVLSQEFGGKGGLSKVCRANEDLVISFYPNAEYDRELIVKQYLSTKSTKLGYQVIRDVCMEEFTAIIIANFKISHNLEDYVFKYKARPKVPKFQVGSAVVAHSRLQDLNSQAFGIVGQQRIQIFDPLRRPRRVRRAEDQEQF